MGHFCSLVSEEIMGLFADLVSLLTIRFTSSKATTISNNSNTTTTTTTTITTTRNEDNGISVYDINMVMSRLGMCCKYESRKREFVTQDEFESLFEVEEPCLEEIWEVFNVFDENKDGFIDALELGRVLCKLGLVNEGSDVERCKKMIKSYDRNDDGLLDFNDFVKFMEICLC